MNIAILEDDIKTAHFIERTIIGLGHNVIGNFYNTLDLIQLINICSIDLILLNINVESNINGIECAKRIYANNQNIKIVFITASKDSTTIIRASSVSPFGYLVKPIDEFDLEAILMVVHTKIIRCATKSTQVLLKRGCLFDLEKSVIHSNGKIIKLTNNELKCLNSLIKNKNSCISAEQLMWTIWDDNEDRTSSLRELIYRLRKKIPDLPLSNIPRVGYILQNTAF